MQNKKGALELRYIILLILGLLVLLAMIFIFREHLTNFVRTITSLSSEINETRPPIKEIIGIQG